MKNADYNFFKKYKNHLNDLRVKIDSLYRQSEYKKEKNLYKIARLTLGSGGKLLRSLLTLLSCEVICGNYKQALPIAVAYELGHNASLVQDDIIDTSSLRRGKPSVSFQYGTSAAILVSNLFVFQIFNLIGEYQKSNLSKERICQILEMVGNCSKEVATGEYLDEKLTGKINLPEKDYLRLISLKTGKLFAASSACGAIAGNGTKREIETMYKSGEKIGIAFQIYDDLLDILGHRQTLKKPTFSDIRNGKQNIIVLHAFRAASPSSKKFLKKIFGQRNLTLQEKKRFKEIIKKTGSIKYAEKKCKDFIKEARDYLMRIKNKYSPAKEKILDITEFVISRNL